MSPETVPQDTTNYYTGVLTRRDFVRPEETAAHNELAEQLSNDLAPATAIEVIYFAEALTAAWRLNRLAKIEARMGDAAIENQLDPMANPEQAKLQQSVDRARNQYNNLFRRAVAEIRNLQKERSSRPARPEHIAMEQKTEQTQSEPVAPEVDSTSPENPAKNWESMNEELDNDAEYQAILLEAYYRALAREAARAEKTEQSQSATDDDTAAEEMKLAA
jgi:hypothetical protein